MFRVEDVRGGEHVDGATRATDPGSEQKRRDAEKCAIRERRARAIVGVRRGRAGGAFGTAPNVCGGMLKANAP